MFELGQNVVYGVHGVCQIIGTEERKLDGQIVTYFVLEPVNHQGARYYIPVHNPAALAKLRPLITPEELDQLLHSNAVRQNCWTEDENQRKRLYRELIVSMDRQRVLQMVFTLHQRRKKLIEAGRKMHQCDENFLSDAEKLLSDEFACVLQIPVHAVDSYIAAMFE